MSLSRFLFTGPILFRSRPSFSKLYYCTSKDVDDSTEVFTGPVPRDKLTISFSRSSGPGGQNVNKLNTKVEIRFHVQNSDWLPSRVKERLHKMYKNRISRQGELIITSAAHRTQHQNLEDAVGKLEEMLQEASEVPRGPSELTVARIKQLKRKSERQRLVDKKYQTLKKRDRDSPS